MQKIGIIGGGAGGLIAAIHAKSTNNEVTILERNSMCGKKILVTGNGKCNYWNEFQDINHYHSANLEILNNILNHCSQEEVLSFFTSLGIVPKIKNGYYYPYSNQATSIRNALLWEAKRVGVKIIYDVYVSDVLKKENYFVVNFQKESMIFDKIILATGSKAAPKTGSDGNGYFLAKKLGHTIIPPLPALVQLVCKEKYLTSWAGVRTDAEITLLIDGKKIKKEIGEIQLTNYGISGICVFNLSSYASRALMEKKCVSVSINFLPFLNESVEEWLKNREKMMPNRTLEEFLEGVLNYKLGSVLLHEISLEKTRNYHTLKKEEKDALKEALTAFSVPIIGTKTFEDAQVCSGGIPLSEINTKTMESKKTQGLYLVGELLDVDGDCGGYNLGFAWRSGILAGRACGGSKNDSSKTN